MKRGIILLALAAAVACSERREFEVDFDSGESDDLGSKDVFAGTKTYSGHPLGTFARKVEYRWELFAGHGVERIQLHFSRLSLPSGTLVIRDGAGNEVAHYDSTPVLPPWTAEFPTNLLSLHLSHSSTTGQVGSFEIDRVVTWTGAAAVTNPPWTHIDQTGARPNVHALGRIEGSLFHQEVWGVLAPGASNSYLVDLPTSVFLPSEIVTRGPATWPRASEEGWFASRDVRAAAGDFSGDGKDDLAVVTSRGEVLLATSVATSRGVVLDAYRTIHRSFTMPSLDALSDRATVVVAAGKIDGDDLADLVAADGERIVIATNTGSSPVTLGGAVSVPLVAPGAVEAGSRVTTVLVSDFDGDGDLDVLHCIDVDDSKYGPEDHFHLYRNDGTGAFQGEQRIGHPFLCDSWRSGTTRRLIAGELDGVAGADLVIVDEEPSLVKVSTAVGLPGVPAGASLFAQRLPAPAIPLVTTSNGAPERIIGAYMADVDGDGRDEPIIDLGLVVSTAGGLRMLKYEPTRTMVGVRTPGGNACQECHTAATGTGFSSSEIVGWENWGIPGRERQPAASLVWGRFTSDPRARTFVDATSGGHRAAIMLAENGLFPASIVEPTRTFLAASDVLRARPTFVLADLDGDRRTDLVAFMNDPEGSVETLMNVSGTSGAEGSDRLVSRSQATTRFGIAEPRGNDTVGVGDFDGDGRADIVVLQKSGRWGGSPGLFVARGLGDGTFGEKTLWNTALVLHAAKPSLAAFGDYDGDGRTDAALAELGGPIRVALSTGQRLGLDASGVDWQHSLFHASEGDLNQLQAADVNADGRDDLVHIRSEFGSVAPPTTKAYAFSYTSAGHGQFEQRHELVARFAGAPNHNTVVVGRFSADPYADFVARVADEECARANQPLWMHYRTAADRTSRQRLLSGCATARNDRVGGVAAAEMDADGREELVTVAYDSSVFDQGLSVWVTSIGGPVDLELRAQPIPKDDDEGIPIDGWTATSTTRATPNHVLRGQMAPEGRLAIQVENKGVEPAFYTLVRSIQIPFGLDVVFLTTNPTEGDRAMLKDTFDRAAPGLLDATDGFLALRTVGLWKLEEEGDYDNCTDVGDLPSGADIYVFPGSGTADARDDGIRLFSQAGTDCHGKKSDAYTAGTVVHEYGHYGLDLRDEYCEIDGSGNAPDCPFDLPENGNERRTKGLCPNSLMADHSMPELCTEVYHDPYGITDQEEPAWTHIGRPFHLTPGPYTFQDGFHEPRFCGGECDGN